jgi:hypothetical protein
MKDNVDENIRIKSRSLSQLFLKAIFNVMLKLHNGKVFIYKITFSGKNDRIEKKYVDMQIVYSPDRHVFQIKQVILPSIKDQSND